MTDSDNSFNLISGLISQDEQSGISIPLSASYSLICESYTLSRDNKLVETVCVSQAGYTSLKSTGALTLKAKGEVVLEENSGFLTTAAELSKKAEPFVLIIGSQIFLNMILKSLCVKIDGYGKLAVCAVEFVQLSGDSNEQ